MAKSGKKRAKAEKAKTQLKTSMKQAKKPKKKDGIRSIEQIKDFYQLCSKTTNGLCIDWPRG